MKKKIIIGLIVGILLLGIIGAVAFEIIDKDFTEKVLTISTEKLCEVEMLGNVFNKKCNKDTQKKINIDENIISITKDTKTGVIRIAVSPSPK